jgi:hypothetical protein
MNRIRALAQFVGFCTLGLLALYGLLALCGVAGPLGLAAEANTEMSSPPGEAAAILGGTIPQTMNYQGFLRDPDGSLSTGSYTITARIYELAAPAPSETVFYETTLPNVTVRDGLFNIVLGDDPPLPPEAFSDAPRYIGIDLNDGGGELIPRQRLHAVPWALTATTLVDNAPAQSVQGLSSSGDITLTGGSDIMVEGGDIDVTGDMAVTGGIDVTGDITVTGDLDVQRKYQGYYCNLSACSQPKELGPWDLCTLQNTAVEGLGSGDGNYLGCRVYTEGVGDNWQDSEPRERGPGDSDRDIWYFWAYKSGYASNISCYAICFNLGE